MTLRTCLLVSDDADDHHAISEAVSQLSERIIVLNILDSQKALVLLKESSFMPDYIFLDLSMHGLRINSLLTALKDEDGFYKRRPVVYGDRESFEKIDNNENLIFFSKDYEYSELLRFLKTIF